MSILLSVALSSVLIAGGLHLQGIAERRRFDRRNEHGIQVLDDHATMQSEVAIDTLFHLGGFALVCLGIGGVLYGVALQAFAR
ncbi:hypothetical protein [Azospirillum soli]|uniref:hypothetical protein n=1 Tax=Azospirillum soli TaxID=1304799 RepID=UPI001AE66202|nr:hypothetical protein [Azospirillum soli]MBP2315497.1 hypothetical protein [Azospirillum soli]